MAKLETAPRNHEKRDISVPAVAWFAVGLIVSAVIIHFGIAWLFDAYGRHYPSPEAPSRIAMQPRMIAPPPQLQIDPALDLQRFRAAEEAELNHYGWIDKQKGIVRLPIKRAMDLIVQRGLPTRKPGSADASGLTPADMQKQKAEATKP